MTESPHDGPDERPLASDPSVTTHVEQARERVRAEHEAVADKLAAFEAFRERVESVPTTQAPSTSGRAATAGTLSYDAVSEDRCQQVRRAFAETVRPHSVDDVDDGESLLATINEELSDEIAVALAPTTDTSFSAELKHAIVAETAARRAETEALSSALAREARRLDDAGGTVDEIVAWLAEAEERPLTDLGFEQLRRRHETLAEHRDRCDDLARRRQAFLEGTTSRGAEAGISHRNLVAYLYGDFPVDHPVLATAVRLDAACADCQRAVREHLTRRG